VAEYAKQHNFFSTISSAWQISNLGGSSLTFCHEQPICVQGQTAVMMSNLELNSCRGPMCLNDIHPEETVQDSQPDNATQCFLNPTQECFDYTVEGIHQDLGRAESNSDVLNSNRQSALYKDVESLPSQCCYGMV
jgi:hypothetical protein